MWPLRKGPQVTSAVDGLVFAVMSKEMGIFSMNIECRIG